MWYTVEWLFDKEGNEKHGRTGTDRVEAAGLEHAEQVAQARAASVLFGSTYLKEHFLILSVVSFSQT